METTQLQTQTKKEDEVKKEQDDDIMFAQPCLPFIHDGAGMIQNPSESDEILMFQGNNLKVVHIYNTKTRRFRKNKDTDFDLCFNGENNLNVNRLPIPPLFGMKLIIDITKDDCIIAFASSATARDTGDGTGFFWCF